MPATPAPGISARRAHFPRGLTQPSGGFRFGADTLLLAAFAARELRPPGPGRLAKALRGLDLGTGSGAASFGLLLLRPDLPLQITGIDTGPEMVLAAAENASALGLGDGFQPLLADVADFRLPGQTGCDFVLANPPFRKPGTGRACPDAGRLRARFEGPGGFAAFAACAAKNLRVGGRLFLVHLVERLPELFRALGDAGLAPRRLLPLAGHAGQAPRLALLSAVRNAARPNAANLVLEPGLALYGPDGTLTPEAAGFCPHLATNPRRGTKPEASTLANVHEAG